MGMIFSMCRKTEQEPEQNQKTIQKKKQNNVKEIDIQKSKLKNVRDKIQVFISKKQAQVEQINQETKVKYQKNRNKKQILPLLQTKKQLLEIIENGQVKLRVINKTIRDMETQQLDADMINVLDDSNKYMAKIQQELQDKDWRGIVQDAKQKYQGVQWSQQQQQDESFKALWKQLGGDQVDPKINIPNNKNKVKVVQIKEQAQIANRNQVLA